MQYAEYQRGKKWIDMVGAVNASSSLCTIPLGCNRSTTMHSVIARCLCKSLLVWDHRLPMLAEENLHNSGMHPDRSINDPM